MKKGFVIFNANGEITKLSIPKLVKTSAGVDTIYVFADFDTSSEETAYRATFRMLKANGNEIGEFLLPLAEATAEEMELFGVDYSACRKLVFTEAMMSHSGPFNITVTYKKVDGLGNVISKAAMNRIDGFIYEAVNAVYDEDYVDELRSEFLPRDLGDLTDGIKPDLTQKIVVRQGGETKLITLDQLYSLLKEGVTEKDLEQDGRLTTNESDIANLESGTTVIPTYELKANKNVANGYVGLDNNEKIPLAYFYDAIFGQLEHAGEFDPNVGYPTMTNSLAPDDRPIRKGDYFISIANGIIEGKDFKTGDWLIRHANAWGKIDNTDAVASVNGKIGIVNLTGADINVSGADTTTIADKITEMDTIIEQLKSLYDLEESVLYNGALNAIDVDYANITGTNFVIMEVETEYTPDEGVTYKKQLDTFTITTDTLMATNYNQLFSLYNKDFPSAVFDWFELYNNAGHLDCYYGGGDNYIEYTIAKITAYKMRPLTAENMSYDNSLSGLTAENVQEAIDELRTEFLPRDLGDVTLTEELNDEDHLVISQNGATKKISGAVLKRKLVDNIVDKTDFIIESSNLYNKNKMLSGYSFDVDTGQPTENAIYGLSEFIKVEPNTNYYFKNITKIGRYNANKEFIHQISPTITGQVLSSQTAYYIRVVVLLTSYSVAQINLANEPLPYEPYYEKLSTDIIIDPDKSILDGSISKSKVDFIKKTSNMLNTRTITDGYSFDVDTGQPTENAIYGLSEFIKVEPNTNYYFKNITKIGRYNANKEFIHQISPTITGQVLSSQTAYYIRVVVLLTSYSVAQINLANEPLPYEPYGNVLDGDIFTKKEITKKEVVSSDLWEEDFFVIEGETRGDYTGEVVNPVPDVQSFSTSELISLYDGLYSSNEDYVSKQVIGTDSLGENIYRYDFKPKEVPTEYVSNSRLNIKLPKIILISGIHGNEKAGVYNLFHSLKQITNNWKGNELLETLRWNVHFIVVPIVNNFGFNNNQRKNENEIDLARNFPTKWELNTSSLNEPTYGGVTPLSEKGSQIIATLLEENREDAIYFGSIHNFGGSSDFIWNASATKLQVRLGKQLVSKMSRKWKKDYSWMPQDNTTYVGYSNDRAPEGSEPLFAASLGIQASTFETCHLMSFEIVPQAYNSTAFMLGSEALINWLIINLRENVDYYNKLIHSKIMVGLINES